MTGVETVGETEVIDMTEFEFEAELPCDFTDCNETATHKLVCGYCFKGVELMCEPHTQQVAREKRERPDYMISFDQSCGHNPEYGECLIEPLGL